MLAALHGLIDVHHQDDAVILRRDPGQIHHDLLVVALAGAGQVVAHVLDGAGVVLQIAEIDDVLLVRQLAAPQHKGGGIAVNGGAGRAKQAAEQAAFGLGRLVPAQADDDFGEAFVALGQADFLALLQTHRHMDFLLQNIRPRRRRGRSVLIRLFLICFPFVAYSTSTP